jgi:hypothetical protein
VGKPSQLNKVGSPQSPGPIEVSGLYGGPQKLDGRLG